MREVSHRNFGLLVAYLIPGFLALWGVGFVSPGVSVWLNGDGDGPTVGGFFYVTIASVGFGMTASVIRWASIDTLHHLTGLQRPRWDDNKLHERSGGYDWLVENHYRYYQFYGNTAVALVFAYVLWRVSLTDAASSIGWLDLACVGTAGLLVAGSRNALSRYYTRTAALLRTEQEDAAMTNGGQHHPEKKDTKKPQESRDRKPAEAAKTNETKPQGK